MLDNIPKKWSNITNIVIFDDTVILPGPVDIVTESQSDRIKLE